MSLILFQEGETAGLYFFFNPDRRCAKANSSDGFIRGNYPLDASTLNRLR